MGTLAYTLGCRMGTLAYTLGCERCTLGYTAGGTPWAIRQEGHPGLYPAYPPWYIPRLPTMVYTRLPGYTTILSTR